MYVVFSDKPTVKWPWKQLSFTTTFRVAMLLRRDASHPNFIWIKLKIRKGRAFRKHEQNEKYRPFYQCFCVKSYDTFSFQRRFLLKIIKNIKPRKLLLRIHYIFSCFTYLWYDSRQKQRGTRRSFLELWITQIAGALVTRTVMNEMWMCRTLNMCSTLAPVMKPPGKRHRRIILTLNGQQFVLFDSSCC